MRRLLPLLAVACLAAPASALADTPSQVVGTGSPASCTSAAVVAAVAAGGDITFNCGPSPVTIIMRATAVVSNTTPLVNIDGGGLVTLSGIGERRILLSDTCAGTWSTDDCINQPNPDVVVQNITLENGYDSTPQATCTQNIPACWYGGVDGGGAIYAEGGQLSVSNTTFYDDRCTSSGPDLGGGAIRALAQYQDQPVQVTGDTFESDQCSNGGALSSISVAWNITGSTFLYNQATGWGANPATAGTQGGGSGGAIYLDGDNDSTTITSTTMTGNTAREGGGAIFDVVDAGQGSLTLAGCYLHRNVSGMFQTFPGVYYQLDGHDLAPTLSGCTLAP